MSGSARAWLRADIVTIFPEMVTPVLSTSMLQRGQESGLLDLRAVDLRDYAEGRHNQVDDTPYGGGAGMVLQPDPLFRCVEDLTADSLQARVILTSPAGVPFRQKLAEELAQCGHMVILCGRYEGIDERVRQHLVTDEISLGDFVMTGGEIAALAIVDAAARLVPGVLGADESAQDETFTSGLLEYPHYTRPPEFRGWTVPEVLLGGNHEAIRKWRRKQSLMRTLVHRPDLLWTHEWTPEDRRMLEELSDYEI